MTVIVVTIDIDNAAFVDNPAEAGIILADVAGHLAAFGAGAMNGRGHRDSNGNTVGWVDVVEDGDWLTVTCAASGAGRKLGGEDTLVRGKVNAHETDRERREF